MSTETDSAICEVVNLPIPVVKKRVLRAMERARKGVELEIPTLANLLAIWAELWAESSRLR